LDDSLEKGLIVYLLDGISNRISSS